jgi:hypothetical protein
LYSQITEVYSNYEQEPFIIPCYLSALFSSKTHLDIDSMQCWLCSYVEAIATQRINQPSYVEAAETFFQPRQVPNFRHQSTPTNKSSGARPPQNPQPLPHQSFSYIFLPLGCLPNLYHPYSPPVPILYQRATAKLTLVPLLHFPINLTLLSHGV